MTRDATSGSRTTKAARLLLMEAAAIEPILLSVDSAAFDLPTVCDGWSVRDVVAHCGAALTRTASGDLHQFTQADNQADVDARRDRPVDEVISELIDGYLAAAASLGLAGAYASEGIHLALDLLVERSERMGKPAVVVRLPDRALSFGAGTAMGTLASDTATFVRICGGRRPDPDRYAIDGTFTIEDLVLFS
jgi:hypothetical protein